MIKKFKFFIKRLIIKTKYKYNWCSKKIIVVNDSHRQLGLSTILIKDALKKDIKIFVPNHAMKSKLMNMMYEIDDNYYTFKTSLSYKDYFVTTEDLLNGLFRGKRLVDNRILIDNSCTPNDVEILLSSKVFYIANGFVFIPYVK